jgi:hypothetical protein
LIENNKKLDNFFKVDESLRKLWGSMGMEGEYSPKAGNDEDGDGEHFK